MTRIRDRFGEVTFTKIFGHLIARLTKRGHIQDLRILVDIGLVEVDDSMDSLVEGEDGDLIARELKSYERRYHDCKKGKRLTGRNSN